MVRAVLFLVAVASVVACGTRSSIVGTWEGKATVSGVLVPLRVTFDDSGGMSAKFAMLVVGGTVTIDAKGTYELDGETLKRRFKSFVVTGSVPKSQLNSVKLAFESNAGEETSRVQWKGADEIVLAGEPPSTLKRVK